MEIRFNFPRICPPRKTAGFSNCTVWALYLLFVVTQVIECGKITQDWDFAFPHHHRVLFYSVDGTSTRETQDLKIPVPSFLPGNSSAAIIGGLKNNNSNSDIVIVSKSNNEPHANDHDVPGNEHYWDDSAVIKIAVDPKRDLIFFASEHLLDPVEDVILLSAFNVTSNEAFTFLKRNTSSITDLLYYKDSLFWSEYKTNTIWKLKVSGEIGTWPREPEIFFTLQDGDIYALTLDRASGIFYWINGQRNQIEYFDGKKTGVVAQVGNPKYLLTTDSSYLYWAKYIDGTSSVERISLTNYTSRETLFVKRRQELHSLAVTCTGDMVITDLGRTQVILRKHDALNQSGTRVFDDHGHGRQLSIDILSRSFALGDWQYCKVPPVENSTQAALSSAPLVEGGRYTTANDPPTSTTQSTSTSKSLGRETSPVTATSSHSRTTTVMSSAANANHDSAPAATVHMGSTEGTSTASIHTVSEIVPITQTPLIISTESAKLTSNDTHAPSPSEPTSSSSVLQGLADKSLGISWCPQNLANPCKKGELCILISNRSFCLDLPTDGARDFYTTQGLQEGQAPSSVHFNGLLSDTLFIVVVSVLFVLVVILSSLVIYMYVRLRRLDKKPRIRRRVIVSRNNQRERGSSVCELIDIENCCNMNECETACYEREPHSSTAQNSNNSNGKGSSTKDDKQKLIEI